MLSFECLIHRFAVKEMLIKILKKTFLAVTVRIKSEKIFTLQIWMIPLK